MQLCAHTQRPTQHLGAGLLGKLGGSFVVGAVQVGRSLLLEQYPLQRGAGLARNSLQATPLLIQAICVASQPEPGAHHQRMQAAEPVGDEAGGEGASRCCADNQLGSADD